MMPRQHAEHAGLGAGRGQLGGRRLGDLAAVAGALVRQVDGGLTLEAEDGAVDDGDVELHRGVVDEVAGGKVVGAVDDHVVAVEDGQDVVRRQAHVVGDHVDVGVDAGQGLLGRVHLALADPVQVVEDLALQVGLVDDVHVDDAEGADAGGGQVEGGGRPEAARSEQQDLGLEQLGLPGGVHLREQQVALVAVALLGGQADRGLPVPALVLPLVEPAGHGGHVGVAELGQGVRGERRAGAAGAVDDDVGVVVGDPALDLALQVAPGDVHRTGERPLLVLVGLPHVEHDGPGLGHLVGRAGGVDLTDAGLGVAAAGHGSWASLPHWLPNCTQVKRYFAGRHSPGRGRRNLESVQLRGGHSPTSDVPRLPRPPGPDRDRRPAAGLRPAGPVGGAHPGLGVRGPRGGRPDRPVLGARRRPGLAGGAHPPGPAAGPGHHRAPGPRAGLPRPLRRARQADRAAERTRRSGRRPLLAGGHRLRHHGPAAGGGRRGTGDVVLRPPRRPVEAARRPGRARRTGNRSERWPSAGPRPEPDRRASAGRGRRPVEAVVHRGGW